MLLMAVERRGGKYAFRAADDGIRALVPSRPGPRLARLVYQISASTMSWRSCVANVAHVATFDRVYT